MKLLRRGLLGGKATIVRNNLEVGVSGSNAGFSANTVSGYGETNIVWIGSATLFQFSSSSGNGGSVTFRANPTGVEYDTADVLTIELWTSDLSDATFLAQCTINWTGTLYANNSQTAFNNAMQANIGNTIGVNVIKVS